MTDSTLVRLVREHMEGLFPKVCRRCGRRFDSLRDYICRTQRVGRVVAYDIEEGDWTPMRPLGTMAVANCYCGTTLALTTKGMPLSRLHEGFRWLRTESRARGLTPGHLLEWVRDEVRRQVLAEEAGEAEDRPA